jgi:hypothetical protein
VTSIVRISPLLLILVVLVSACKVERTPPELHGARSAETTAPEDELRARVNLFLGALDRGDAGDAVRSLSPLARVRVVDRTVDAPRTAGPEYVEATVARIAARPLSTRAGSLDVDISPGGTSGWFAVRLVGESEEGERNGREIDLSGVFWIEGGEWQLTLLHVAEGASSPPPAEAPQEDG